MRKNLFKILKMLSLCLCVLFLLTACGKDNGSMIGKSTNSMEEVQQDNNTCWQGDLLKVFYKNLGDMALTVYSKMTAEDLMRIMMLAFSIWMAFQILRHVATPVPESIGEFWTKIIRKAALCVICGTLASSNENIMYALNTFVFPIYLTLLDFCNEILKVVSSQGSPMNCQIDSSSIKMTATSFPQEPLSLMSCMTCAVNDRLSIGYKISLRIISDVSIISVIIGGFIFVAFTIAKFCFALYLIDSIFRLDIMVIIAPFLILFYPFEQTRRWTITGFKFILNSAAIMLCLGLLISMTIMAMQDLIGSNGNYNKPDLYRDFGVIPISLIFMGFLIIKTTGEAINLAGSITGGSGDTRFQKKMAAFAGTIAKGLFALVTMGAGRVVTAVIDHFERLRELRDKARKVEAKINRFKDKLNKFAGR